jgi:release factor glutamine methyltransferase
LQAQVAIVQSDLLSNYPYTPDIVVANLPYVDATWDRSPELAHEPADALFANDGGLAIVRRCLQQCTRRMKQGGLILLEVDTRQLDAVAQYGTELGLTEALRDDFAISFYV